MGRLGQVVEGGGKSLLFAIGNYVNQRLLHPFHVWVAEVLRRLPQDGTFNQTQPFDRLVGSRHSFSFDLKSATDRWLAFSLSVLRWCSTYLTAPLPQVWLILHLHAISLRCLLLNLNEGSLKYALWQGSRWDITVLGLLSRYHTIN